MGNNVNNRAHEEGTKWRESQSAIFLIIHSMGLTDTEKNTVMHHITFWSVTLHIQ